MVQPKINTCGYCGHTASDVNHVNYRHIGGQGEVLFPVCDDVQACIKRVESTRGHSVDNCPIGYKVCYPSCYYWDDKCIHPDATDK